MYSGAQPWTPSLPVLICSTDRFTDPISLFTSILYLKLRLPSPSRVMWREDLLHQLGIGGDTQPRP